MTLDTPFDEGDLCAVRARIRSGEFTAPTSRCAPGRMQVNMVILPSEQAETFRAFCDANPRPCPLLAVSAPGDPRLPVLGPDIDVRTDLPGYRVWENGAITDEPINITTLWRDDLVAFALGCSFGFDAAVAAAGIEVPHVTQGRNVPMYDSTIALTRAGVFGGTMVVSLRRFLQDRLNEVVEISRRFPQCHGAPVHVGDPAEIGILDIEQPDYGDPPVGTGVPVFWACGVTPQAALRRARLPFAITHSPGKMLVCDVPATYGEILNIAS
ncbi:putative hydro-lyase [Sulfitobacter aestuariivivens]|uniref:Hydro-lyase n=1 Tax=Sulfitobacter aestuariivivens TaxID=2766981 RepID=A0A927D6V4_9RHOB|nr:putative hydro-lyase [Sulfitobacter aestuariivivens]MBD3666258.1 putative hydro-lyase [Sulfitobacter aestuariivivens]